MTQTHKEIDMCAKTVIKDFDDADKMAKIPFSELRGICKVWMSDDFNEPLDEMKEYME